MKISKNTFVKSINKVMNMEDMVFEFYKKGIDIIEFCGEYSPTDMLISVLDEVTNLGEWVAYYAFELDFGRRCEGKTISVDDEDIDISTPEKLYDFLESMEK